MIKNLPRSHKKKLHIAPKSDIGTKQRYKSDKTELLRRVRIVEELLITGASRPQILHYISLVEKIEVSDRQVRNYIRYAHQHLERAAKIDRRAEMTIARKRLDLIFNLAVSPGKGQAKNLRAAVQATSARAKLLGLNAPTKVDPRMGHMPETVDEAVAEIKRILNEGIDGTRSRGSQRMKKKKRKDS